MKEKRIISIILTLIVMLAAGGCSKEASKTENTETATNVTVSSVIKGNVEASVSYTGEVKASKGASVSAKVSGAIRTVNAEIGDYVNAGTVLATIDSSQYSLAYNQAEAAYRSALAAKANAEASYNNVTGGSLEQSRANMNQAITNAQSAYNTALDNYNRQKSLYDIGAISKVSLDSAKTSLDNAKVALDTAQTNASLNESVVIPQTEASAGAGLSQAEAGVSQAKAALDIASQNLSNCTITAPISGYITSKNVSMGQTASPGIELFAIKNTEAVEVELNVTESVIASITQDTKASVTIKSAGITDVEGVVTAVANAKNDMTGMYLVKVSIPNSDSKIKVGMLSEVILVTEGADDVLIAPSDAISFKNDKYFVYVAKDGKAERRDVTISVTDGKVTQILSGLKEGEKVIVEGKDFISEKNNKIRIVE